MSNPGRAPSLEVDEYLKHLHSEYLSSYVVSGGSSVKFVATDTDAVTAHLSKRLAAVAIDDGYLHARLDAGQSRTQLIDEMFFAISRQVDWLALGVRYLQWAYASLDLPPDGATPAALSVQVRHVARANDLDAGELYRTIRRFLERRLLGERGLLHQFRIAMLRLCQTLLGWTEADHDEQEIVLRWLRGHSVPTVQLRTVDLYSRIARHQARYVFASFTRWVHMAGLPGVVVELDLTRLGVGRRPPISTRRGFYYTKSAVLDTFEILRQFVDTVDDLQSSLLVVTMPVRMVTDTTRGLPAYHALYLRVAEEVYDHDRANPFGSLVRVTWN
jgi:hypothetical protein